MRKCGTRRQSRELGVVLLVGQMVDHTDDPVDQRGHCTVIGIMLLRSSWPARVATPSFTCTHGDSVGIELDINPLVESR